MPKTTLERNNFVRGLITEATPLTFPENALLEESNFVLNRDGSLQRRFGMDYETNYSLINTTKNASDFESLAITSFKWENVGDDPTISVGVIQVGNRLHLLDLTENNPSANLITTLALSTSTANHPMQFAVIKGVLLIASVKNTTGVWYVERDSSGTYILGNTSLLVRDIWGVDDGLDVDERPTTLSDEHKYNLLNQGWTETNYNAVFSSGGEYPSNSDVMQYGKDSSDNFTAAQLDKQFFGNSPAVKGKNIISAYTRGTSRINATLGSPVLPADQETNRAITLAAYAGRMFYSGVQSDITSGDDNSPNYSGTIFFTQVVKNVNDLGKCYQEADPTSEHISDLLATDGGTINIPEASNIYRLINRETSLVVMAENGVWEITGPDGVFRADDFSVSKITSTGVMSKDSVVNVEENIMYWSDAGIYVLSPNPTTGRLVASNLTETTIQTLYISIPSVGRLYAKGNYDRSSRKVSWLYNDTESYDGTTQTSRYNKELIFDIVLQAFYTHEINDLASNSPYVAGYMPVTDFITVVKQDNVVVNGVPVVVNGEQVVVSGDVRSTGDSTTKYITIVPDTTYDFTLSNYGNTSYLDWESADSIGVDASAYILTGYELFADSQRRKYIPYLTAHFRRTEVGFTDIDGDGSLTPVNPSSCLIQAQWDFANSANSGKWGQQFQAYRLTRPYMPSDVLDTFDYGYVMISTKIRIRGSGQALSLRFDTEAGNDLHIYGWAFLAEGNENV